MYSTQYKLPVQKIFLIITIFVIFSLTLAAQEEDSLGFRGTQHNGIFTIKNFNPARLNRSPQIVWQKELGNGYSAVAVKGDLLYTMGNTKNKDTVYCLDANTGKEIWSYTYDNKQGDYKGPYATPLIDEEWVYTLSKEGTLICFMGKTGKILWQESIKKSTGNSGPKWGIAGSPVISGDVLLLNELSCGIAFDKNSGKILWQSTKGDAGYATPVFYTAGSKQGAVIFGNKTLFGIEPDTGKILWEFPWSPFVAVNAADPLLVGNQVFVSSAYGKGCALLDFSGSKPVEVWKNNLMSSHFNSFIYLDGCIYGNDGDTILNPGTMRCLDWKTGKERWGKKTGLASLILVNDYLVVLTAKGGISVVKAVPAAYQEIASCKLPSGTYWTAPVAARGKLFCRNAKGTLYCLSITG